MTNIRNAIYLINLLIIIKTQILLYYPFHYAKRKNSKIICNTYTVL